MSGNGALGRDEYEFDDVEAATLTYTTDALARANMLSATSATSHCVRQPSGHASVIEGTAEWDGTPGYDFVLHALHIPATIVNADPGARDSSF
jgi:hypothetical protein